ncbi:10050_t:CDS:2 [Dentiscutata heterogama]|uniref:10050_t:CDS:1 n=1 Tax=Dentiscutata heterogama TaxID=1316150 RepID=A0ACA9LPQ3_9GLOM|nr:10050_t:CDS:2 [Dentiscutata heterogama]
MEKFKEAGVCIELVKNIRLALLFYEKYSGLCKALLSSYRVNALKTELEAANIRAHAAEQELKKFHEEQSSKEIEFSNLQKKCGSYESDLDETEKNLKETTEKLRESELKCETLERKVAQLENEVAEKEKKIEELIEECNKLKAEYESVISSINFKWHNKDNFE